MHRSCVPNRLEGGASAPRALPDLKVRPPLVVRTVEVAMMLLLAHVAAAQTPPRVEFDEAIQRAIERNPTIAQAATNIARAEAIVMQVRAFTLPQATVAMRNVTIDNAVAFAGGVAQPQNQFAFSASVGMTLAGWRELREAREQVGVAAAGAAEVRHGVAVAAAQTYLTVIASRRQVEVVERSLEAARVHVDYAEKRLTAGAGSRLNHLRAAQAVAAEELRLEGVRLALRRSQEALGVILAADGPVDAGAEPVLELPASVDESAWTAARPDLQTRAAIQRAAERVVRDSWIDWLATPTLSFDPQVIAPQGLFQPARTWRFTMTLSQPLFDGGTRRARRLQRQSSVDESKLAVSGLQIQARSEVRIAQEAVASLERALVTARLAVDQAREVLRITTTAFEVGATTNLEVIDAQRSARDAETAAAQVEDGVRRARLDLIVALGRFPK